MNIKLISITQPQIKIEDDSRFLTPEELIVYCARVSNPSNQLNIETAPKLINYCIKNKHWSIFEQVDFTVEIKTSRAIAAQILRHKSASFQEFCITGDSLVTTVLPSNNLPNYIPIKKLYDRQKWKNYKDLLIKVYNNSKNEFETSKMKEVFYIGKKPVYKVILSDGKSIECTKEHKFLSKDYKFLSLENIVGLDSKYHVMTKTGYVAVNGIPCYQNKEWLSEAKKESINNKLGLKYIAKKANVSYHTIRKWLKKLDLRFTKKEISSYCPIWNKGKFGYTTNLKHSEQHLQAIRLARSKEKSNWWKGGCDRSERLKIADWCQKIRQKKLKEFFYRCKECNSNEKLELDHIIPVWKDKSLAYDYSNIQVLCSSCHDEKHNLVGEPKIWSGLRKRKNQYSVKFVKIDKIIFLGERDVYDLEVENNNHNYIANKIVVHNSQRYAEATEFEDIEFRLQGKTNRQVGDEIFTLPNHLQADVDFHLNKAKQLYDKLIKENVAKECARFILPLNTQTTLYMKNNIRNWIMYFDVRCSEHTQKEHRLIANKIKEEVFIPNFPNISKALEYNV